MLAVAILTLLGFSGGAGADTTVYFEEKFDSEDWESRWVHSTWKGSNGPAGKFEWSAGEWFADEKAQKGIRTPANMRYYGISAKTEKPFSTRGKDLVLQFSVKQETSEYSFCGGGYIKLLGGDFDQATFGGSTPYMIMFGPDVCGYDVSRIHLIFTWEGKNLLREPEIKLDYDDKNEYTHLYTLVVKPDNTYVVYLDLKEKSSGSLHEFWAFPNKTNDDPSDSKPSDWVETAKIEDPSQKKPDNWVDAQRIRDPTATVPEEWDVEEDGEWEAPMIDNPAYHGSWFPDMIDNPEYKGVWKPRQLQNPAYVENVHAYDSIGAVGFELWTVNKGSIFDNILVCDSIEHAMTVGEGLKKLFDKEKDAKKKWQTATGKDTGTTESSTGEEDDDDDDEGETVSIDGKKEDL